MEVFLMNKAKITFSNNETLIIKEGDLFTPINPVETEDRISSSLGITCEICSDHHDGLIPSLTELFFNGKFFCTIEDHNIIYNTASIVKVENI